MKKSILQKQKHCFITGSPYNLQRHHIYFGNPNRKISDKYGFWVWLTGTYHNQDSRIDVHHNIELDLMLKRLCQREYEKTHTREDFIALIGKSYI